MPLAYLLSEICFCNCLRPCCRFSALPFNNLITINERQSWRKKHVKEEIQTMFDSRRKASLICICEPSIVSGPDPVRGIWCLLAARLQTAVIDVAYGPSRRWTDGGIILMVKLDTGLQCACVQRTLPHAGPTLGTTVRAPAEHCANSRSGSSVAAAAYQSFSAFSFNCVQRT